MMKYVKNPWVLIVVCMILTAVLYNAADGGIVRWLSYVPLAVLVYLVGKAIYMAWFVNKD